MAGAFLTDADRFPWKSQSEFCVVRATHKFKSLGFVCSPRLVSPFFAWSDFQARSRFAPSTIPEEKWGTARSLIVNCLIPHLEKSNAMLICNTDAMGPVVNPHWH